MQQGSVDSGRGVLDPTVPVDIAARSQRQRIADAMVGICAEKTFAATTIADIVAGAGISRTTFYKHFSDKRACFDAALDECLKQLRDAVAAAHTAAGSPAEEVRAAAAAILDLLAAKPSLGQVVLGEAVTVDPAIASRYLELAIPALEKCWSAAGEPKRGSSNPRLAFARVQILVFDQLAAGKAEQLPELLPEIVYNAVLPYAGHEEALRQARSTPSGRPSDTAAAGQ